MFKKIGRYVLTIGFTALFIGVITWACLSKSEGQLPDGFLVHILVDYLYPLALSVFWLAHLLAKTTSWSNIIYLPLAIIAIAALYVVLIDLISSFSKRILKIIR